MQEKEQNISPIKQRILSFIETLNISKREFYAEVGISRGTLESKTGITEDVLAKFIARYPHVSIDWLINGKGVMCINNKIDDPDNTISFKKYNLYESLPFENKDIVDEPKEYYRPIPFIPIKYESGMFSGEVRVYEKYYVIPELHGADFLITVHGESMYPNYRAGDIVACKKIEGYSCIQWGRVYVIDMAQGPIIKRIKPLNDDSSVLIVSDNPDFFEFELKKEDIRNLALVLGSIRAE